MNYGLVITPNLWSTVFVLCSGLFFNKDDSTFNRRAYPVATEYFVCARDERHIRVYLAT